MEFKHFQPIQDLKPSSITPNFPGGLGSVDFANPKKNLAHFEELAASGIGGGLKTAILKNTHFFANDYPQKQAQRNFNPEVATSQDSILPIIGRSSLGFPILSNLQIVAGEYFDNQGVKMGEYPDINLDIVLMEITGNKNLVTTDIQGRNGTIIEYISAKSMVIDVKGRFISAIRDGYPYTQTQDLYYALNSNKSLKVNSWFLNMFGIYNIVPQPFNFIQEEGSQEYQKFEFKALADAPVILRIKK